MAIAITTPTPGKFGFIINATSADVSACEELKAAPGVGKQIIVDHITITNGAAGTQNVTIGQGVAAGGVETALIGPMAMAINTSIQWTFPSGMWLAANKSLTIDSDDTHNLAVFAWGRIE